MNYADARRAVQLANRTRDFLDEEVIPIERDHAGSTPISSVPVADLRQEAREVGLYAPQIPTEHGGLGLDLHEAVPVFEAAGRSLLGPSALRMEPPTQGNIRLLQCVGTDAQRNRWLDPLVSGDVDSAFSMTEPKQGTVQTRRQCGQSPSVTTTSG